MYSKAAFAPPPAYPAARPRQKIKKKDPAIIPVAIGWWIRVISVQDVNCLLSIEPMGLFEKAAYFIQPVGELLNFFF